MNGPSFDPAVARRCRVDRAIVDQVEALAGGEGSILVHAQRDWTSATFKGMRHQLTMAFDGEAAVEAGEAMIAALPDRRFEIPRHLVADATVKAAEHRMLPDPRLVVEIELLLLEES